MNHCGSKTGLDGACFRLPWSGFSSDARCRLPNRTEIVLTEFLCWHAIGVQRTMIYRIGCSGYYYPSWRNTFYPPGLARKDWLKHYSSVFNTVELNSTFYRKPGLETLQKYKSITPSDFTFSVKMSRYITHIKRLQEKELILEFQDLINQGLGNKINYYLFQMPPTFRYTEENLERIIAHVPHRKKNVIEFRHISWWNSTVAEALNKAGITFCNVDYPGLDTYFITTTTEFYLRLHGSPHLFVSPYNTKQLQHFAGKFPKKGPKTIYFNNTTQDAAFKNALQLSQILDRKQSR